MNFLFVLPVLSEAYYRKRIDHIRELDIKCSVYGFDRDHYEGKDWDVVPVFLGYIKDEKYLRRILHLFQSIRTLRRAVKDHRVLYAFNLDILFLVWMASLFQRAERKIIYDVADIRPILIEKGVIATAMRTLERFLLKRVDLVVVASPAFIDGYFKDIQHSKNEFFVIENKVDPSVMNPEEEGDDIQRDTYVINIGYFGGLRCEKSLEFLYRLMKNKHDKLNVTLRGFFFRTEEYQNKLSTIEDVTYKGSYTDPDDLFEIYSEVDLIWSAHMHGTTNTKWAISNRFYQACYFKRPLIAQEGTIDAKRVKKYQIGCIIDLNDTEGSLNRVKNLNFDDLHQWKQNMYKIPKELYTLSTEYEQLIKRITHSA